MVVMAAVAVMFKTVGALCGHLGMHMAARLSCHALRLALRGHRQHPLALWLISADQMERGMQDARSTNSRR
jgi:hypothetical protein